VWVIELLHRHYGDSLDKTVLTMLAIALITVGTLVLVRSIFISRMVNGERESFELVKGHKVAAVLIGATTGFVIGLTSAGSGTVIAVFLIVLYRMAPRQVVGTDVFHAAILLWAAGLAHWIGGNVDFGLVGTILIGSVPGIWIGSHLTVRLPTGLLRMGLGVVLIASSLALFNKAGADIPLPLTAGIPLCLAAGLIARHLSRRARAIRTASSSAGAP
jgi:uncharacterized membrane protein YfcA